MGCRESPTLRPKLRTGWTRRCPEPLLPCDLDGRVQTDREIRPFGQIDLLSLLREDHAGADGAADHAAHHRALRVLAEDTAEYGTARRAAADDGRVALLLALRAIREARRDGGGMA